jgi:Flp pilus assembly protein TadD
VKRAIRLLSVALLVTACSRPAPAPPVPTDPGTPAVAQPAPSPSADANYQPDERHRQALNLLARDQNSEAASLLAIVVADHPNAAEAWNDLSYAQTKLYRYAGAAESARRALALNPQFVYAEYNLGYALLQTNDWRDSRPHLEVSRTAQPDRPEPLYALALWEEKAGNKAAAIDLLRLAAAMEYEPALSRLAYLTQTAADDKAAADAQARFPQVPLTLLRQALQTYREGVTSQVLAVLPLAGHPEGGQTWAVLVQSDEADGRREIFVTARADGNRLMDRYIGTCQIFSGAAAEAPAAASIRMDALPIPKGVQHVLVSGPGQALVCGEGTALYRGAGPAAAAPEGFTVGADLFRFSPLLVKYLPQAEFARWNDLFAELRQLGHEVRAPYEGLPIAVGQGDPLGRGRPAQLIGWAAAAQYRSVLSVAVKYEGEPVILHQVKEDVMFPDPYEVGIVRGGQRTFLAVATLQPGAPNGGDVVVLEWDSGAGAFRTFAHLWGDSAGFDEDSLVTSFKKYREQGGYDRYVTTHQWDEAKQEFAKTSRENVGHQ